jgi:hypothetical protein
MERGDIMALHWFCPGVYVLAAETSATADTIIFSAAPNSSTAIKRPNFFAGRLLDAKALASEQDYQRDKRRRHNLAVVGFGIVSGLAVGIDDVDDKAAVVVSAGFAIDSRGDEISVPCRVVVKLPKSSGPFFVAATFVEIPCDPIPTTSGPATPASTEEACLISIVSSIPDTALGLAKVICNGERWNLDLDFAPTRACRSPVPDRSLSP